MCGRYAITLPPEAYRALFAYSEQPNFPPRFNVAPTQPVPIVHGAKERRFRLVRWGFLPGWVKDPKEFPLVINARDDSLLTKPTFKGALKYRRCIFLADGFYEWQRRGREKAPYLVRMADGGPMPLAGLWETYNDPSGGEIDTAAIVTTDANGTVSGVHNRMPAILSHDDIGAWLDTDTVGPHEAMRHVRPCPDEWITMVPVSTRVNKVQNDDPELQVPLAAPESKPVTETRKVAKPRSSDEDEQGKLF
jgi:putative SOS response-associated peptidase YedK